MGLGQWLFSGRLRRLERAQEAAVLLAAGRLEEAEEKLEMARPRRYSEDLGVYHFVQARLLMARGVWADALVHLETAQVLGLTRPTVELHRALVLARLGRCLDALGVLDGLGVDGSQEVQEQARALRAQLGEILSGESLERLRKSAQRAAEAALGRLPARPLSGARARELVAELEERLPEGLEEAALALGWVLSQVAESTWVLGLEPLDHGVTLRGVLVWPGRLVQELRRGIREHLLPPELSEVLER